MDVQEFAGVARPLRRKETRRLASRLRTTAVAFPAIEVPMAAENKHPLGRIVMGWRCATCGEPITRVADGWVEWLAGEDDQGNASSKGLRLVHILAASPRASQGHGCQYDERQEFKNDQSVVEGLSLERFVGPDGLMLLLSLLAADELPRDELLELAKRVQIPGYEQARHLFPQAIADGLIEPSIGVGYYLQSEIQSLLTWAARVA
jgi:hypothetical protein